METSYVKVEELQHRVTLGFDWSFSEVVVKNKTNQNLWGEMRNIFLDDKNLSVCGVLDPNPLSPRETTKVVFAVAGTPWDNDFEGTCAYKFVLINPVLRKLKFDLLFWDVRLTRSRVDPVTSCTVNADVVVPANFPYRYRIDFHVW